MVESTQESLNPDSSIEIEKIIECIYEYTQQKNIAGYLTQEKGDSLCDYLIYIFQQYNVKYIYQPNGSQQFPDFTIFNQLGESINLECKTGNKKIMWNDGWPKKDTIYIFYCSNYKEIIILDYTELIDENELNTIMQTNQLVTQLNQQLKLKFQSTFKMYIRKANNQKVDIKTLQGKGKKIFTDFMTKKGKQITQNNVQSQKKALSLFSGCGGDTIGLEKSNIKVTHFVEINQDAIQSHLLNFPDSNLLGEDIIQIEDEQFSKLKGNIDLIFGGFPCQSFSHGGKKDPDDPRGWLFIHFVRAVQLIQPRFIIGENVKGILTRKTTSGILFTELIKEEFSKIGYDMSHMLVNADDFGLPQHRQRVLFIGTQKNLNEQQKIMSKIQSIQLIKPQPIESILEDTLENAIQIDNHPICDQINLYKKIPDNIEIIGKSPTMLTKCFNGTSEHGFSYEKRKKSTYSCVVNISKITNTIQCTYGRMPRLFVPIINSQGKYLRPFTINELKQIQGFPKDYKLSGDGISQIMQVGNAVPPQIVSEISKVMFQ